LPTEIPFKLVDIEKIPGTIRKSRSQWTEMLEKIPAGKAMVIDTKEVKTTPSNIAQMIKRVSQQKGLNGQFRVMQRTIQGRTMIYILNEARETKDRKLFRSEQPDTVTRLTG
jgi:hypothetical protein